MATTGRDGRTQGVLRPPLVVGRDATLDTAEALLADVDAGRGRVLLIAGEAGIGKTTVAREIARRATDAGLETRWAASFDGASLLPFGVWIDCLRQPGGDACAEAAANLEGIEDDLESDAAGAHRQRLRRFRDVVESLRQVAATRPQALVLEDLHWADGGSVELLTAVAAATPAMRTLLVGTYRPEELSPSGPLATLGGGAEQIVLDGLAEDDVGLLLADVLERPAAADEIRRVYRQTGGNPLFVTQVARLTDSSPSGGLPTPLQDVLARRLARVAPHCDEVLGAASAIGLEVEVDTLAAVVDEPRDKIAAALDEAAEARLGARVDIGRSGRWQFLHDLVRVARYEMLGRTARERWHRRVVDVLAETPGVAPSVLAHHASLAGLDPSDPRRARYQVAAARESIRRMAWTEAVTLAERALQTAPPGEVGDEPRADAWLITGEACLRTGDHDRAGDAFTTVSQLGRQMGSPELIARAALGFGAGLGGFEVRLFDQRQIDLLDEAASALSEDSPLRPIVLARLSVALSMRSFNDRRLVLAEEAVALARRVDDPPALAAALAAHCDAVAGPDHVSDRIAATGEIIALARRAGDRGLELLGRRLRVVALLEERDLGGLDAEVVAYDRTAAAHGDPFYGWYPDLWRAMRAHADGRLDEAEQLAERVGREGAGAGSRNATLLYRIFMLFLHLDRGEGDQAMALWHEVIGDDPEINEFTTAITAFILSRSGRVDEARVAFDRFGPEHLDAFPKDQEWLVNVSQAVVTAARVGDLAVAARAHELLAPYGRVGAFEGLAAADYGVTHRFVALAAGCGGDVAATVHHVDEALALTPGSGRLVEAHTRADCARALLATRDPDAVARGMALGRQARSDFESMGLEWLATEIGDLVSESEVSVSDRSRGETARLAREGESWAFTFDGSTVRVNHTKGVADLAMLLPQPDREVHVRTLTGAEGALPSTSSDQPALDDEAVRQYRQRLHELEAELDEADRHADLGRSSRLAAERDALVEELTRSFGLGGRRRAAASDPEERMRKAVSARIKAAIGRLEDVHPALGKHLRASVYTGYWCSYRPERPIDWTVIT